MVDAAEYLLKQLEEFARGARGQARGVDCGWGSEFAGDGAGNWREEFGVCVGLRGEDRGAAGGGVELRDGWD